MERPNENPAPEDNRQTPSKTNEKGSLTRSERSDGYKVIQESSTPQTGTESLPAESLSPPSDPGTENPVDDQDGDHTPDEKGVSLSRTFSRVIYASIATVTALAVVYVAFFSTASQLDHHTDAHGVREGLAWVEPPREMTPSWSIDGYTDLISTPGAAIATTDTTVTRIDSITGEETWSYSRPDSTLCHTIEAGGDVVALFNSGNGCSDITMLDSATGEVENYSMYGVESDTARLVHGNEHIAIVTPDRVRFLSMSLTPRAEFGDRPDALYPDDQQVTGCTISDVAIGPDVGVVAATCEGQNTYHINAVDLDPEENTEGNLILDVDTKSTQPVSIPMVSLAQVLFIVPGAEPKMYAWQLDKEMSEISSTPMKQGVFPRGHWDFPSIGYVWLIGEDIHVRFGSEDISQSTTTDSRVIGNPLPASRNMLLPTRGGIDVWNPSDNSGHRIEIDGFNGTDFAFAGGTVMTFDRDDEGGTITGYSSPENN